MHSIDCRDRLLPAECHLQVMMHPLPDGARLKLTLTDWSAPDQAQHVVIIYHAFAQGKELDLCYDEKRNGIRVRI